MFEPKKLSTSANPLVTPPNSPVDKASNESLNDTLRPGHAKRIHSDSTIEGSSDESHGGQGSVSPLHQQLQQTCSLPTHQTYKPSKPRTIDPADRECLERFLKINARHITDGQGVVMGVLLVTPNALMFDPNVSDPLVIEHGGEMYGVTVPMEMVLKTALYSDIAHMRVKHVRDTSQTSIPKPEVYYAPGDEPEDETIVKSSCGQIVGAPLSPSVDMALQESHSPDITANKEQSRPTEVNASKESDTNDAFHNEENSSNEVIASEECRTNNSISKEESQTTGANANTADNEKKENVSNKSTAITITNDSTDSKRAQQNAENNKNEIEMKTLKMNQRVDDTNDEKRSSNSLHAKVTLGLRHSVPESIPQDRKSTVLVTAISAEESMSNEKRRSAQGESRREQMLKRLSNPVDTIGNLTKSGISSGISVTKSGINKVLATPKNIVGFSSGLVRDALGSSSSNKSDSLEELSKGNSHTDNKKQSLHGSDNRQSSIGFQNMVDSNMVDVFANFEKLIPRPSRSCEDPPLYLCLRMGRPTNKKLQKYSPSIISFGKKKIEREYWFSIPREKADILYHFLQRWAPHIYGDVDDITGCEDRGLVPIDTDDEMEDEDDQEVAETDNADGNTESTEKPNRPKFWRKRDPLSFLKMVDRHFTADGLTDDWQIIPSSGMGIGRHMELTELPLPELIGSSDILTEELRKKLCKHLPARAEGYSWTLIYSSSKHGFSLKTLYREMSKYETPVLLIIQDTFGITFGALTSCGLRLSDHFYGTGETFLFTFHPEFQCFPWTGENLFFIKGNQDSIAIGAGDGNFGLWLDGDIFHGRSYPCKTFGNSMLSVHEDFVVKSLECWGFI